MAFDPDEYLKTKEPAFDPNAYLASKEQSGTKPSSAHLIPVEEGADIAPTELPDPSALDYARGGLETAANVVTGALAFPLGVVTGLPRAAITGENFDPAIGKQMEEFTYQPRGQVGQAGARAVGEFINRNLVPVMGMGHMPTITPKEAIRATKARFTKEPTTKVSRAVEELNAPEAKPQEIPNLKATEGEGGQMALFDIPEEARVPMPFEAKPGDWRIDEHGMPIRADLSLDVQHAQTPLQRDLWVDQTKEFAPMQETGRYNPKTGELEPSPTTSYPVSLDTMDWAHRRGALKKSGLMKGEIVEEGRLPAAALEAELLSPEIRSGSPELTPEAFSSVGRMKGQGGAINPQAFAEGFRTLKKITEDLAITAKGLGDKLSVEAWSGGKRVGGLLLEKTNKYDPAEIVDAFAPAVGVDKSFRGKGIARKMYQAAADLGNDIVPSKRRTAEGQKMWEGFEKSGLSQGMRIPKSQRGAVYFGDGKPKQTLEQFTKSLQGSVKETSKNRALAVENYKATGQYQWDKGTQVYSPKTGKTYEIIGHDVKSKTGEPMYLYKTNDGERGSFYAEKAQETLKPLSQIPFNFKGQGGGIKVDWGNKDKVDALKNVPGLGSRLREVAHAQIESPEKAIELSKDVPDVQQNAVQKGINALTKGGIYLKAKVNNPIVHFGVDRFLDADNKARAEISEKLHGSYLPTLRSLSETERTEAFTILNAADLNKRTITPEMMDRWELSPKQKEFIQLHQERMADVLDKINVARAAVGKKPIAAREAYSAMNMTGDFRKVVTKNGEVVGVIGANTKSVGKNSLATLEKKVLEKDPTLEFGPLQEAGKARTPKGSPHEAFMDVLQTLGEDNPNIKQFLDTLAEVAKDDPSNYMGMQKHTMQKKGVWGMEGRKPWLSGEENAKAFFENQVKYMESAYQWAQLTEAAKDVNHVLRDPATIEKQGNAIKLTEQYMQNALGMETSRVGEGLNKAFEGFFHHLGMGPSIPRSVVGGTKTLSNTMLLSLNPGFWAINLIQPVATMPGMTSMLSSLGLKTGRTFGMYDFAKGNISFMKKLLNPDSLSSLEKGAFDYAKENHVYATDMVEHAYQVKKGVSYYTSKITQGPAAGIETSTRATLYMSFVHMLSDAGIKGKEVYQQSHRLTDMAMNNYAAIEKPTIYNALGPVGSMAYNLRSYGHNEISRFALYARELAQHGNAKPMLTQMATTIAFAGVMGLPFFTQWDELYKFITSKIGKPRSLTLDTMEMSKSVAEKVGTKYQYALSHGLFTLAGVDISKRVGLGDILPNTAAEAAFAGGGKLASMGKSAWQLATSPSEETAKAAAYNWAPQIAQGPMDLSWYQKGDLAYSKDPEKLRPLAKRNATDKLMRAIGLQGISESTQKTSLYEQKQLSQTIAGYRTTAMNTIAQDLFRNRPISQSAIKKYFVDGQGDGKTFETDLSKLAVEQNISPQDLMTLKDAASKRIPQLRELQRNLR